MKTTLNIADQTMKELKRQAAVRGQTMSELTEAALRAFLHESKPPKKLPPLPVFHGGVPLVDVSDRDALYDAMER